ncbi:hypothetical protein GCM10028857_04960 [Salinarchaeum chitinilyticum]
MSTRTRAPTTRETAPQKTKLVAGTFAIGGVGAALSGLFLLVASSQLAGSGMGGLAGLGAALGVVVLAIAGVSIAVAYGLWTARRWGWYAAVALLGLGVVNGVWTLLSGAGLLVIPLVLSAGGLWVLWEEQAAFGLDHELPT